MKSLVSSVLFSLLLLSTHFAAPGDLDVAFGNGGKVVLSTSANGPTYKGVRIFPNGDLLVFGGSSRIISKRLKPNGDIDYMYGNMGGLSWYGIAADPTVSGIASDVEILSDGSVIVVGKVKESSTDTTYKPAMWRFDTAGILDRSFGTDGRVLLSTTEGKATEVEALNGKLYVAYSRTSGEYLTRRFAATGSTDINFGNFGLVQLSSSPYSFVTDIDVASVDGKPIVTRGSVRRYNTNGSVDTTFGVFGNAPLPGYTSCTETQNAYAYLFYKIDIAPDGKIIATGAAYTSTGSVDLVRSGVSRYASNGRIDSTFNNGNIVCGGGALAPSPSLAAAQSDRKIIFTSQFETFLQRLTSSGSQDSSYPPLFDAVPSDILIQSNDRLVVLYPQEIHRRLP